MSIVQQLVSIPGPKSNFIFGNAIELFKEGTYRVFPRWTKQYGPILGFYIGGRPQMLISDIDLIRQILVTYFHSFTTRNPLIPGGVLPVPQFQKTIAFAEVNTWKKIRSMISPSFTISKLKAMEPVIMSSVDRAVTQLSENAKCGEELSMGPLVDEIIFSLGTNCILGVNLALEGRTKEMLSFYQILHVRIEKSILSMILVLFPSLTFIAYPLRVWWEKIRMKMLWSLEGVCVDVLRKCVAVRKNSNTMSNCVLQILLNAEKSGES